MPLQTPTPDLNFTVLNVRGLKTRSLYHYTVVSNYSMFFVLFAKPNLNASYPEYTIDDICMDHGSLVQYVLLSEVSSGSMVLEDANTDSGKYSYQRSKPKPDRHSLPAQP